MEGELRKGDKGHQRSISSPVSSPEFEFNFNPSSIQQTQLLSADQLFADGILLPLQFLSREPNGQKPQIKQPTSDPTPSAISSVSVSHSKRWTDMFRLGSGDKEKQKEENSNGTKKKKKKTSKPTGVTAEQININIWPFSRSRSAGSRPRSGSVTGRKVSSEPCSRSNSGGGAGGRRWAGSPGRGGISTGGGVHVGRSSPVWQVKKKSTSNSIITGDGRKKTVAAGGGVNGGVKVLNLNVNGCIGSRQQTSCRGESSDKVTSGDRSVDGGSHSFSSLKTLFFSRKVH